jgi:pSer/pThr/pTyr-binding forkhead associated (FHA) protein
MATVHVAVFKHEILVRRDSFSGGQIKIGRTGDIRLEDPSVSRLHAVIEIGPGGASVVDLGSASGTFLNGRKVSRAPLGKGDAIDLGSSKVVIEDIDTTAKPLVQTRRESSTPRYCSLKILDKCPHCGAGLPMNGLLRTVLCGNCQKETTLKPRYWKSVLEDPDNDYVEGGGSYTLNFETSVSWRAERPKCVQCSEPLPVDDVPVGTDGIVACSGCGHANSTYPAPSWLAESLPSARQVYCGERPATSGDDSQVDVDDGSKPVVLSCPQCRGSLKVTSKSDRMVPCEYCGSDVYLPDDLWRRLHPVKTSSFWYIRYEGKSLAQIERERELAEAQRRREAEEQEFQASERQRRKLKPSHFLWTAFGAFIATVVLSAILPIFAGDGDPLFGIAGRIVCPGACEGCEGPMITESWTTQTSDGTSTQYDFYCSPPGAQKEAWTRISDGAVILTMFVVLLPVNIVLALIVLVFVRLSQRSS